MALVRQHHAAASPGPHLPRWERHRLRRRRPRRRRKWTTDDLPRRGWRVLGRVESAVQDSAVAAPGLRREHVLPVLGLPVRNEQHGRHQLYNALLVGQAGARGLRLHVELLGTRHLRSEHGTREQPLRQLHVRVRPLLLRGSLAGIQHRYAPPGFPQRRDRDQPGRDRGPRNVPRRGQLRERHGVRQGNLRRPEVHRPDRRERRRNGYVLQLRVAARRLPDDGDTRDGHFGLGRRILDGDAEPAPPVDVDPQRVLSKHAGGRSDGELSRGLLGRRLEQRRDGAEPLSGPRDDGARGLACALLSAAGHLFGGGGHAPDGRQIWYAHGQRRLAHTIVLQLADESVVPFVAGCIAQHQRRHQRHLEQRRSHTLEHLRIERVQHPDSGSGVERGPRRASAMERASHAPARRRHAVDADARRRQRPSRSSSRWASPRTDDSEHGSRPGGVCWRSTFVSPTVSKVLGQRRWLSWLPSSSALEDAQPCDDAQVVVLQGHTSTPMRRSAHAGPATAVWSMLAPTNGADP